MRQMNTVFLMRLLFLSTYEDFSSPLGEALGLGLAELSSSLFFSDKNEDSVYFSYM